MGVLLGLLTPFRIFNDAILALGRTLAMVALAVMVVFILAQVFYRYALNAALPWPDEGARFMMLWMTGLIAPAAYRKGGFVAIDMFERALPRTLATLTGMAILIVSLLVLIYAVEIAWSEVTGFAGTFKTASLYTFVFPSWGDKAVEFGFGKMPRSHMMASMIFGLSMMIVVNIELLLRALITLLGGSDRLPELEGADVAGAE